MIVSDRVRAMNVTVISNSKSTNCIKFIYCEKATKLEKNLLLSFEATKLLRLSFELRVGILIFENYAVVLKTKTEE